MDRVRIAIGAVITVAWLVTVTKGVLTEDYAGLDLTTPVMLIFCGFVFGESIIRRHFNGNPDE